MDDFVRQVSQETRLEDWPLADSIDQNVPVYAGDQVRVCSAKADKAQELMLEWARVFSTGPGLVVIKNAMPDMNVIDNANTIFTDIINAQRESGQNTGDHFAKPNSNDRVWNALEKHCMADPVAFSAYYANPCIALVSHAWLGPGYQVTAQVNRVNPGGSAQMAHRDYHLGFMSTEQAQAYPQHAHNLSPALTLQGAVAHCDMPLESGPTLYLPYSQLFEHGYIVFPQQEYQDYFNQHHRQLALQKGDMVFFNPAVMHAAGENKTSDISRLANLLQVSSAFGRSIETVDRVRMLKKLYPHLLTHSPDLDAFTALSNVIAASAEGYAFPTNLDSDPPVDGMAPKTQQVLVYESLQAQLPEKEFNALLDQQSGRKLSVPQ